ncbi:oligoribonuclease [Trueperella pecoris]|uniref:Oligoribonuclease n=2 Tax=Trueperella pecoris TaxID=2733571 RepID=A0A7M1R3P4_9ACTO|nr:oligoribonuclease [Trueperella pecoris]
MVSNFNAQSTPIVWIDCEMTGLNLETDSLVEIAVVVTDSELNPLDRGLRLVMKPTKESVENMNPFVVNMHTVTGLIDEWDDGLEMHDAEAQVLDYVRRFVPEARKAPLGGNSVGTDRTFLARDMPELVEHLHYRVVDVSSIKELAKRWYPRTYFAAPEKTGNHTALGDIYDSIDELRYYRAVLMPDGEGPSTEESREVAQSILDNLTRTRAEAASE